MSTPWRSKTVCSDFARGRRSRFCEVCGHTHGEHPDGLPVSPFVVFAELVYDPETDTLR